MLVSGASAGIDSWDPSTITSLSSNHTVIVFDSRGVGNTTTGSKPFSMQQLANDTAGLMYALKIQKGRCSWIIPWIIYSPAAYNYVS